MKKVKRTVSLIVLLGLFTALVTSGQVGTPVTGEESGLNLQLLITVNRMELSRDQMEALHEILTGVLAEINALESDREAFEQEMLAFTGTGEELDELLETHRETMEDKASSLQETVEGSLDEIQELLTMEQGKILERGFPGFGLLFGGQDSRLASRGMRMGGRGPQSMAGPLMRQFGGNGATDRTALQGQLQQLMDRGRERLGDRLGVETGARIQGMGIRQFGRPLSILEDLVEILEAKLASLT